MMGGPPVELRDVDWLSRARFQERIAETLRVGRVLLAGDAAHVWPAVGGHGMAVAILAACNLAWRLAAVVKGQGPVRLLDIYGEEQRAQAAAMNLGRQCVLLGHRQDIADLHQAFDLFVQSSEYEGTPNAVLEAMAMETPLVATDVGGTGELAAHGIHGWLVPCRDVAALQDAVTRALDHPDDARHRALLYVPSGGIGGFDALKAACAAGVDEVTIAVTKPPAAWKGIPYVEGLGIDLDGLDGPVTLFEGTAREGVPHFPANVNIAAALSLAGIGFDGTRLLVVADPELKFNTHFIRIRGPSGSIDLRFENVPSPENPKTSWLACYSALAALRELAASARYGT